MSSYRDDDYHDDGDHGDYDQHGDDRYEDERHDDRYDDRGGDDYSRRDRGGGSRPGLKRSDGRGGGSRGKEDDSKEGDSGMDKEYGLERTTMEQEITSMMTNGALLAGFAFAGFTSVSAGDLAVHNSATAGAFSILATLTISISLLVVFLMSTLHLKLNWDYRLRPREDHYYCQKFYETFAFEFDVAYYALNVTILGFLCMVAALGWVKLQSAQWTNTLIISIFVIGLTIWFFHMRYRWDAEEFEATATLPSSQSEETAWRSADPNASSGRGNNRV